MARPRTQFVCTDCGNETPRWQGQCPACQGWNTLVEERVVKGKPTARTPTTNGKREPSRVQRLGEVSDPGTERWSSGIPEFDFVLGGGIVPGSLVLIGGEPGIGKSTLLLQTAAMLVASGRELVYVTGEESVAQLRMRSDRLSEPSDQVEVLAETDLDAILNRLSDRSVDILLVDSIQTIFAADLDGVPGSLTQVRETAARLQRYAKTEGTAVFLVGHVTKGGAIAGPKTLEHIVDTVLYFESAGGADHRVLRATKNRFGGVDEIGVFSMSAEGLKAVANPSELFLGDRDGARSGCAVTSVLEGSRPLLIEVQALATRSAYGAPQRVASGMDQKRLALLLAVLEKRGRLGFGQLDVFINVAGGLRVREPAVDAAIATALASTVYDRPLAEQTMVMGEIGLGGELRAVSQIDRRLAEAARMGFRRALVPEGNRTTGGGDIQVVKVKDLPALLERAFG